jgi:lipid-binding SYLF domain-containing protein
MKAGVVFGLAVATMAPVAGCATAPKSAEGRQSLQARADATINEMIARDPGIRRVLNAAPAYAVFPDVGKGGIIIGGAFGRGVLYERGRQTGYVKLEQASIGAQLGAQTFAELLVLNDPRAVEQIRRGELALGADAGAVALTSGAVARAQFQNGVQAFVLARGGLMAELSLSGQRIKYVPRG